jgi:nanoRNase/pAp phosphatase (c-di-AMP/oligoRNAs hydrolase)
MHSNATGVVFRVAGDLMSKGADVKRVSKELFHTTPVNKLRLWGRILERAYVNEEGILHEPSTLQDSDPPALSK